MLVTAAALGLLGLAAASPIACDAPTPSNNPHSPEQSSSKGFSLFVNVTDQSREMASSVHGKFINGIHTGAGLNLVGLGSDSGNPLVFYQNGTESDVEHTVATIVSDLGTPVSPFGFSWTSDKDGSSEAPRTAHLNGGPGQKGLMIDSDPPTLDFEYLAICNEPLDYYQGKKMNILKQLTSNDPPSECVPVKLIAQCAELDELKAGAISNHDFARDTPCYKDVSAISWAE